MENNEVTTNQLEEHDPGYISIKKNWVIGSAVLVFLIIFFVTAYVISRPQKLISKSVTTTKHPNQEITQTASPLPSKPENINAITADVTFDYFVTPFDEKTIVFKHADFKTNTLREFSFPQITSGSGLEESRSYYVVSPNQKYVARVSRKKLEVASLTDTSPNYKVLHEVPTLKEKMGNSNVEIDFLHMGDVYWGDNNTIYFLVSAGIDAVGVPEGGAYTDLYKVNPDGSNKTLLNDHTKEKQNYGFGRGIYALDTLKQEIYLSTALHAGHIGNVDRISLASGEVIKTLSGISSDAGEPVFNKDFSKAYYIKSLVHSDGYLPTHLYEYDMNSAQSTLLYTVEGYKSDDTTPSFGSSGTGLLINNEKNLLYFEENNKGKRNYYSFDISSKQKKLLFTYDEKNNCWPEKVANNAKDLLLVCHQTDETSYEIFNTVENTRHAFFQLNTQQLSFHGYPRLDIVDFH